MVRQKTQTPVAPSHPAEPLRSTKAANLRASSRVVNNIEAGEERVMLNIRSTGHNRSCHEPIDGMTDQMLVIRLADAMDTTSPEFTDAMLANLLTVFNAPNDRRATREMNAALAVLDGMKPENEVEAMLLTQMVATNDAAMKCLAQITNGLNAETFGNLAVKMMRTYAAQAEVLAKLRRKGEQVVRVVHVHPGGQAVVGDVHHHPQEGGGLLTKNEDQPDGTEKSALGTALLGTDALGHGLPISGDAERQVPPARRKVARRSKG